MRKFLKILPLIVVLCAAASLPDDPFRGIQCDSDVIKTLTGRRFGNGTSSSLEKLHKDLGLKDLGGDEYSDLIFLGSWKICDQEYMLLINTKRDIISDVLKVPEHTKKMPEFVGECEVNGVHKSGGIVAILENVAGKDLLPAKAAWKIDEKTNKFVPISTEGLRCARNGIITEDQEQ